VERKGNKITDFTPEEREVLGLAYFRRSLPLRKVPAAIDRLFEQASPRIQATDAMNIERYGSLPDPNRNSQMINLEALEQLRVARALQTLTTPDHRE